MSRSEDRQDGGPVALLPEPRERRKLVSQPNRAGGAHLDGLETCILLVVAYLDIDGRGADVRIVRVLTDLLRRSALAEADTTAVLDRLEAAGLVEESHRRFHAAAPVRAFLEARTFRRGVGHDLRDLRRFLGLDDRG
jgi:hypothetical protein